MNDAVPPSVLQPEQRLPAEGCNQALLRAFLKTLYAISPALEIIVRPEKILPTVLIIIDVCAALAYIPCGEWRRVIYWLAAAALTTVVTW